MKNNNLVLGLDTSNYTTSAALTAEGGEIIADRRMPLKVKQGERGLRQSHALFQHVEQLPALLCEILDSPIRRDIRAVAASERPRPVEGSYMPVFNAGVRFGSVVAKSLQVPFFCFSHQEGHLAAAIHGTSLAGKTDYLAWHLSGGTCELLSVTKDHISIAGGSKDISFGQLIDRLGVTMGLAFPCGRAMDLIAEKRAAETAREDEKRGEKKKRGVNPLKPIPTSGLSFNVSGIETQARRLYSSAGGQAGEDLVLLIFQRIGECLSRVSKEAGESFGIKDILFTGGVSASGYLRRYLQSSLADSGIAPVFGEPSLSSDNAVGISLLGGRALWP